MYIRARINMKVIGSKIKETEKESCIIRLARCSVLHSRITKYMAKVGLINKM